MSIAILKHRGPLARITASTVLIATGVAATASSGTTACSADLRDLYECDALVHALCKKYKECGSVSDEDTCYDQQIAKYVNPPSVGPFSSDQFDRKLCLDSVDDQRGCLDAIDALSCTGGPQAVSACGITVDPRAVPNPDAGVPTGSGSSSGGSSGTSSSSGGSSSGSISSGDALTTESSGVVALAVDSSYVYWINGSHQLRAASTSGPLSATGNLPTQAAKLVLSGDYLYVGQANASAQILRIPTSLFSGGGGSTDQVGTATDMTGFAVYQGTVIYTSPNGAFQLQPSYKVLQSTPGSRTAPSFDSSGSAYWATLGLPQSTIWQWTSLSGSPQQVTSAANVTGVFGKFYVDSQGRLYHVQNGPLASAAGASIDPSRAGTDGDSFYYSTNTSIMKVTSTGSTSVLTSTKSSVSVLAVSTDGDVAYADSNGSIYRAQ